MKSKIVTIERTITRTEQVEVIELQLTIEEAKVIHFLTGYVGGDPKGPRGVIDKLRRALSDAGAYCNTNGDAAGLDRKFSEHRIMFDSSYTGPLEGLDKA